MSPYCQIGEDLSIFFNLLIKVCPQLKVSKSAYLRCHLSEFSESENDLTQQTAVFTILSAVYFGSPTVTKASSKLKGSTTLVRYCPLFVLIDLGLYFIFKLFGSFN